MRLAMAPSALRFADFEPDEAYDHHVKVLRRTVLPRVLHRGPYEAVYRRHAACQEQTRKRARELPYSLGWCGGDPAAFLRAAQSLAHPAQQEDDDLPGDLCRAVAFAVRKGDDIVAWRTAACARIDRAADELWPLNERMLAVAPEHVRHTVATSRGLAGCERSYNIALVACLTDATARQITACPAACCVASRS